MNRRNFLKHTSLASTALLVPAFLRGGAGWAGPNSRSGKILVVVQLSGGNDGLNTIVPYRNDLYYQNRPSLAIAAKDVLPVGDELGFNPALAALRPLYDNGRLSVINNVGYPNPDRSHFRSMDIWHTASDSTEYLTTGWLGRYLDSQCAGCQRPYHAIEVDAGLSLALKGEGRAGFALTDQPRQLQQTADNFYLRHLAQAPAHAHEHEEVAYLYKTLIDTQSSADYLVAQSRQTRTRADYPATAFGRDLRQVAELILAGTETKVYYLSLTGFDTHATQRNRQETLLKQYAEGMATFVEELARNNLLDDTLILTFSEFGRRVRQNASNGTDHGAANNLFLIGGHLRHPGFFNDGPDLTQLDDGDLRYQVDFRQVYAGILHDWLDADATEVLGRELDRLVLVK